MGDGLINKCVRQQADRPKNKNKKQKQKTKKKKEKKKKKKEGKKYFVAAFIKRVSHRHKQNDG